MKIQVMFLSLVAVCAAFGYGTHPRSLPFVKATAAAESILHVSVIDQKGNYITGFSQDMFKVTGGKEPLEIKSFTQNEPAEVLILIDKSNAISNFYQRDGGKESFFYEMVSIFLEDVNPASSFSVHAFNNAANPSIGPTSDKNALLSAIRKLDTFKFDKPKTIYDDIYFGIEKLNQSSRKKRVLLVFTKASPDMGSKHNAKLVRDTAKMNNVLIFSVAIADRIALEDQLNQSDRAREQMAAFDTLADLTPSTGGKSFFPQSLKETALIFQRLREELRHQYTIGIRFNDKAAGNRWYSIKVKVNPPKGIPKFVVRNQEEVFVR